MKCCGEWCGAQFSCVWLFLLMDVVWCCVVHVGLMGVVIVFVVVAVFWC